MFRIDCQDIKDASLLRTFVRMPNVSHRMRERHRQWLLWYRMEKRFGIDTNIINKKY